MMSRVWGYAYRYPPTPNTSHAPLGLAPGATITVFQAGTVIPVVPLYDIRDGSHVLANPFVADVNGFFFFYCPAQAIDVQIAPVGGTPYTIGDYGEGATQVPAYTKATLPVVSTPNAGALARVTNDVRGLWMDTGVQWVSTSGEVVNAKEFGAVGDGVADDKAAILAALAAVTAAGGTVYLPRGTYLVSPPAVAGPTITIPSKVTVAGAGPGATTIKLGANAPNATQVVGSATGAVRCGLRDLTINGNRAQNAQGVWGAQLNTASFSRIQNVEVTGTTSHGIQLLNGCTDNLVLGCTVADYGQGVGGFGILVFYGGLRNKILNNFVTSSLPNVGIGVDAGTTVGGGVASNDNLVQGNTIVGADYGIGIEDSHYCVVDGNTLTGQSTIGIIAQPGQQFLTPIGTRITSNVLHDLAPAAIAVAIHVKASRTYVGGNLIYNCGNCFGIKIEAPTAPATPANFNIISGNTIEALTGYGILIEDGYGTRVAHNSLANLVGAPAIYVAASAAAARISHLQIVGNLITTVSGNASHGIALDSTVAPITDVQILDNDIRNVGIGGLADGIELSQAINAFSRVLVRGNAVLDDQGVHTTRYGLAVGGAPNPISIIDLTAVGMTLGVFTPGGGGASPGGPPNVQGLSGTAVPARNLRGSIIIADAAVSGTVNLPYAEVDATYLVVTAVGAVTGAPAAGAYTTWVTTKLGGSFVVNLGAAPGAGTSVTVDWILVR